MPVYDPLPPQMKAEILSHLLMLARSWNRDESGGQPHLHGSQISDLISNIKHFDYTPSPRQLHALSQQLDLTIGGAFKLFGYSLESMRQLDFVLNGARTRIIETYPFYRDRPVDVPAVLGEESAYRRTSFLSELVRSWRHNVPIRAIRGPNWRGQRLIYAQIGTNDGMALPRIPPGSVVGVSEIDSSEHARPDPEHYYFLQHGNGYTCS